MRSVTTRLPWILIAALAIAGCVSSESTEPLPEQTAAQQSASLPAQQQASNDQLGQQHLNNDQPFQQNSTGQQLNVQQMVQSGNLWQQGHEPRSAAVAPQEADVKIGELSEYRLSGPYVHENLSIFLIHGADRIAGKVWMTLDEALATGKVVVHETGTVNELSIENVSDVEVLLQAGDIVKGGRQDRVIAMDVVLSADQGKLSVTSFCVEQGRWSGRAGEASTHFESSEQMAGFKATKLALRSGSSANQGQVWASVNELQQKLGSNLKKSVNDVASPSSLQLTLEDGDVAKTSEAYVKTLEGVVKDRDDAIGFVFAVNGKLNSGEVYVSAAMFGKLWPRLLKASAVEAVAEKTDEVAASPSEEAVRKLLSNPTAGKGKILQVGDRMEQASLDYDGNVVIETRDRSAPGQPVVRRSYFAH